MAGWNHTGAFVAKACVVCDNSFYPKSGIHKFCSDKCKGRWPYITGAQSTENQYANISGDWKRYLSRLCCRSQQRANISVEDLLDILEEQDRRCAISGVELTCKLEKGVKFKTNASVDRIAAGGPYIKENVQLVCSALNSWRSDTDLGEFIWWCAKVTEYQKNVT